MAENFDIIVLGAGPGGYVAAERAGHLGKRVLLIEEGELGGVCLNSGCVPTKSLLHSAKLYRHALESEKFGVRASGVEFDLAAAMSWKDQTVATLRKGVAFLMKKAKVQVLRARARIVAPGQVEAGGTLYSGRNIIIATGSRAAMPPIPGIESAPVVDNRGALSLSKLPKSVAVIGGGVVGMEFASLFSSLGVEVDLFEMLPEVLPTMEPVLAAELRGAIGSVRYHLSTRVLRMEGSTLYFAGPDGPSKIESLQADLVLAAAGRVPNVEGLGLEALNLDITKKGIRVDEQMRTNIPGVYAVGDVTGTSLLAHSASRMGEVAVNSICGIPDRMRYEAIPWAVYTNPEAAGCGLTLAQAQERGIEATLKSVKYQANGRNLAEHGPGPGTALQVVDKKTGRILGVHLLGAYASENIAAAAVLLETDVRTAELRQIVFPHPTVSEVIREAAFAT